MSWTSTRLRGASSRCRFLTRSLYAAMAVRTADTCAMMLLQAMRATSHHEARLRQGIWQDRSMVAKDARSSTLGIVGLGKIGKLGNYIRA